MQGDGGVDHVFWRGKEGDEDDAFNGKAEGESSYQRSVLFFLSIHS